jgi:hypothetical protein
MGDEVLRKFSLKTWKKQTTRYIYAVPKIPALRSSNVPIAPVQVEFRECQNAVCILSNIYVYTQGDSSRNRNSNTLDTDRPQHDRPAPYVIAQQYSSNFVALLFHLRKEKFGGHLKNVIIPILFLNFNKNFVYEIS